MHYDIGHFDLAASRVEPVKNPFGQKVLISAESRKVAILLRRCRRYPVLYYAAIGSM